MQRRSKWQIAPSHPPVAASEGFSQNTIGKYLFYQNKYAIDCWAVEGLEDSPISKWVAAVW